MKRCGSIAGFWLLVTPLAAGLGAGFTTLGCGASGATEPDLGTVPFEIAVSVDPAARHQTMQGFGASVAFEISLLTDHPNHDELYQVLFADLGIQVLRIANWYQDSQTPGNPGDLGDFNATAALVAGAHAALGHDPVILMSSWSPPPSLKSIDKFQGGTLGQSNGAFRYADFGAWWRSSLDAYAAAGVVPTFVSIQNEPDFVPTGQNRWSACLIDASENRAANAGYGPALDAVTTAIADLASKPTLLGPEVSGIAGNRVQGYLDELAAEGRLDELGGVAHHLYNGGNAASPASFAPEMNAVAIDAGGKPLFQTEFGPSPVDMFNTAWLIHNAVTVEGVSTYLHWDLIWGDNLSATSAQGLVSIEDANAQARWQTAKGYRINDAYYAVRHFAKWIDVGWQRVDADTSSSALRASAFGSPDGQKLTVVLLNTDVDPHAITVDNGGFASGVSAIYRTSGSNERTAELGPLARGQKIAMPGRSLVTVTFTP
jgi:glucuronoarabinoxylan endo-1,4-beta-xylanase